MCLVKKIGDAVSLEEGKTPYCRAAGTLTKIPRDNVILTHWVICSSVFFIRIPSAGMPGWLGQ